MLLHIAMFAALLYTIKSTRIHYARLARLSSLGFAFATYPPSSLSAFHRFALPSASAWVMSPGVVTVACQKFLAFSERASQGKPDQDKPSWLPFTPWQSSWVCCHWHATIQIPKRLEGVPQLFVESAASFLVCALVQPGKRRRQATLEQKLCLLVP